MIARFCIAAAITLSLSTLSAAQPRIITPVSAELEALARDIVVLGPGEFLYGLREPAIWLPAEAHAPLLRLHAFLESRSWQAADVVPLFKHPDPRVRTLALVSAYATDDPKLLPAIDVLVDDAATTFPEAQPHSAPPMMKIPPVLTQQTVGQIAAAIVPRRRRHNARRSGDLGTGLPAARNLRPAHQSVVGDCRGAIDAGVFGVRPRRSLPAIPG